MTTPLLFLHVLKCKKKEFQNFVILLSIYMAILTKHLGTCIYVSKLCNNLDRWYGRRKLRRFTTYLYMYMYTWEFDIERTSMLQFF